jgi:transposase
MEKKILYVGLDVDDKAFHGCALIGDSGEVVEFKSRPHIDGLTKKLADFQSRFPSYLIKLCYEATYIGFTLQRDLAAKGFHCDVIAPGSIPKPPGEQVKTDRVDAAKLCQFYAAGILSIVTRLDPEIEKDRDLMRSRQFMVKEITELRTHIHSLLRRAGRNYRVESGNQSHWGKLHMCWIQRVIDEGSGTFKINLGLLFEQLKLLNHTLLQYNQAVEELAHSPKYERQVQALTCYRGVKNIFALVMITEIGNIKRFTHPRKLASWSGMEPRFLHEKPTIFS